MSSLDVEICVNHAFVCRLKRVMSSRRLNPVHLTVCTCLFRMASCCSFWEKRLKVTDSFIENLKELCVSPIQSSCLKRVGYEFIQCASGINEISLCHRTHQQGQCDSVDAVTLLTLTFKLWTSHSILFSKYLIYTFICPGVPLHDQGVQVRQSFPLHSTGEIRHLPDPTLSKEMSRLITSQGNVVRFMRDKSIEVHVHYLHTCDQWHKMSRTREKFFSCHWHKHGTFQVLFPNGTVTSNYNKNEDYDDDDGGGEYNVKSHPAP